MVANLWVPKKRGEGFLNYPNDCLMLRKNHISQSYRHNILQLMQFLVPTACKWHKHVTTHCNCYKIVRIKTPTELTLSKYVQGWNSFTIMKWWHKWFLFTRILLAVNTSICCHLKQQELLTAQLTQVRSLFCAALCYRCSRLPCWKVTPWIWWQITLGVL